MSIEKNIVFLFPIMPSVQELKKEIEEDDSYIIYEMDSIGEYKQLIGILEHVVTFSSDMKKTSLYLQENKNFVNIPTSLNIAVTSKTIPSHIFGKLQKYGLNEIFKDNIQLKTLRHKIDNFFKKFEVQKEQEQLEKQKASMSNEVLSMTINSNEKEFDSQQKQHVERMTTIDEEDKTLKRKEVNLAGLSIEGNPQGGHLGRKVKNNFNPQLGVFSSKKLKKLDLPGLSLKLKKATFTPVDRELERKKVYFEEQQRELNKKRAKFEEVQRESNRKKDNFEEVQRQYEHKDLRKLEEREVKARKKLNFDEVQREYDHKELRKHDQKNVPERKSVNFDPLERSLEIKELRKNKDRRNGQWSKKKFQEFENKRQRKKGVFLDESIHQFWGTKAQEDIKFNREHKFEEITKKEKDTNYDEKILKYSKKDWGEQTLDYGQMKKEMQEAKSKTQAQKQKELAKKFADNVALTPDVTYYYPKTDGLEYFIHLESFYHDKNSEEKNYFKFLHFSLKKELDGVVSFYINENNSNIPFYIGHKDANLEDYKLDNWEELEVYFQTRLEKVDAPTWKDTKYQSDINEFIYPYYYEGNLLGHAVAHFRKSIRGHVDAMKAELMLMAAKGMVHSIHEVKK